MDEVVMSEVQPNRRFQVLYLLTERVRQLC